MCLLASLLVWLIKLIDRWINGSMNDWIDWLIDWLINRSVIRCLYLGHSLLCISEICPNLHLPNFRLPGRETSQRLKVENICKSAFTCSLRSDALSAISWIALKPRMSSGKWQANVPGWAGIWTYKCISLVHVSCFAALKREPCPFPLSSLQSCQCSLCNML